MRTRSALMVGGLTLLLAGGLLATPAAAAGCFGKQATITGSNGRDRIRGTNGSDVIVAKGGNDVVAARGGKDLVCGGGGHDAMHGGSGKDRLRGDAGDDVALGAGANDVVQGNGGHDALFGGSGNDRVLGHAGEDLLRGEGGNDRLRGADDGDLLLGDTGNDVLDGGGSIFDMASFFFDTVGVSADLTAGVATSAFTGTDTLTGIEDLEGTGFDDTLTGNGAENFFLPGPGNDTVNGVDNFDQLIYVFSTAPVTGDLTTGTVVAEGTDTATSVEGIQGSELNDTLAGDAGDNFLFGYLGNDTLAGMDGDDLLDGFEGIDTGDGGNHVIGDLCVSIEIPTNCESFGRGTGPRIARDRTAVGVSQTGRDAFG
ncbi:MAG TPA: calcium-binding protein [Actinomycetota bacterium]|nr:calcium-binding protein [Actinomycetota bacterium]